MPEVHRSSAHDDNISHDVYHWKGLVGQNNIFHQVKGIREVPEALESAKVENFLRIFFYFEGVLIVYRNQLVNVPNRQDQQFSRYDRWKVDFVTPNESAPYVRYKSQPPIHHISKNTNATDSGALTMYLAASVIKSKTFSY